MALSAAEQYMLELINRARLDPLGEAARTGIALNDNLAPGTLHSAARGVLAPEAALERAAIGHSQWMLANDVFSHTGAGGSSASTRAAAAGYEGGGAGENISWRGSTGAMDLQAVIGQQHADLFRSAGHRANILYDGYREIGVAQEAGIFTALGSDGLMHDFNASMVTQNFSNQSGVYYVTGVVYTDSNADAFYSIGEGRSGATFATAGDATTSAAAGGYALQAVEGGPVLVTGSVAGRAFSVRVTVDNVNAKLDLVSGATFHSSADITLVSGVQRARLLGTEAIDATGNAAANILTGNAARNVLSGLAGNDILAGNGGHDILRGGSGHDRINGGLGNDFIYGDSGNDTLTGSSGADTFLFNTGAGDDVITDFTAADRLRFDDALWSGTVSSAAELVAERAQVSAGDVVIDMGGGHSVTLDGVASLSGLAGLITLF